MPKIPLSGTHTELLSVGKYIVEYNADSSATTLRINFANVEGKSDH